MSEPLRSVSIHAFNPTEAQTNTAERSGLKAEVDKGATFFFALTTKRRNGAEAKKAAAGGH